VALFAIDNGNAEEVEINALQDRAKPLPKQDCSQQGIRERLDAIDNVRKETAVKSEQKERPVLASLHRHVLPPDGVACQGHGCPAARNRPTARRHAGLDHGSFKSMIYAYLLILIDSCVILIKDATHQVARGRQQDTCRTSPQGPFHPRRSFMILVRRNPFEPMITMCDEMHRRFHETVGQVRGNGAAAVASTWEPPVDLYETDDALVLQVELPGVSKDAVNVELHEHTLTLSGERMREPAGSIVGKRAATAPSGCRRSWMRPTSRPHIPMASSPYGYLSRTRPHRRPFRSPASRGAAPGAAWVWGPGRTDPAVPCETEGWGGISEV
jgi:hypothetical protein